VRVLFLALPVGTVRYVALHAAREPVAASTRAALSSLFASATSWFDVSNFNSHRRGLIPWLLEDVLFSLISRGVGLPYCNQGKGETLAEVMNSLSTNRLSFSLVSFFSLFYGTIRDHYSSTRLGNV
jgi:hypothetical protein